MERSERSALIGVNVKPSVKEELIRRLDEMNSSRSETDQVSMSRFMSDLLEETLKRWRHL
jgi:hypothetical protein